MGVEITDGVFGFPLRPIHLGRHAPLLDDLRQQPSMSGSPSARYASTRRPPAKGFSGFAGTGRGVGVGVGVGEVVASAVELR